MKDHITRVTIFDLISVALITAGAVAGWCLVAPRSNVLAVPAAVAGAILVRLAALSVLQLAWPGAHKLPRADGCHTLMFTVAALGLGGWLFNSAQSSRVVLSERTQCVVHFWSWCSGNCILDFYRDGKHVGSTTLDRGMLTHPLAVFPGPAGQSVVCFSWLDTTYAAFSVDLREWPDPDSRRGVEVPPSLDESVNRSDFPVRACTQVEVAFVAELITHADPSRWARSLGGGKIPVPLERESCLRFLRLSTTPCHLRDASLQDGYSPKILPTE